uniref:Uncharacterized protein n=1 Tax=Arundo donax TaxID=35708 RepID=A0A0A9T031_ARUDO
MVLFQEHCTSIQAKVELFFQNSDGVPGFVKQLPLKDKMSGSFHRS